ncbi:MAG TPA: hypothetical protein VN436_08180, partial [Holophaga sp.]|nr:hypothetical protein [Holophaga sp.]
MKIALLNVVADGDYQYIQEVPLGVLSLASFLREKGYTVEIHQCFSSKEGEIEKASRVVADVYGFQLTMVNFLAVQDIVKRVKTRFPKAITT